MTAANVNDAKHRRDRAAEMRAMPDWMRDKINFLNPAKARRLKAVGEVARAGRTLSVSEVHLYEVDEAGGEQLCALATVTLMILEREAPSFQQD
jgi:acyl-coenzyme A thioesterase PaaI-like protein